MPSENDIDEQHIEKRREHVLRQRRVFVYISIAILAIGVGLTVVFNLVSMQTLSETVQTTVENTVGEDRIDQLERQIERIEESVSQISTAGEQQNEPPGRFERSATRDILSDTSEIPTPQVATAGDQTIIKTLSIDTELVVCTAWLFSEHSRLVEVGAIQQTDSGVTFSPTELREYAQSDPETVAPTDTAETPGAVIDTAPAYISCEPPEQPLQSPLASLTQGLSLQRTAIVIGDGGQARIFTLPT